MLYKLKVVTAAYLVGLQFCHAAVIKRPPNIVVILADDLGVGDIQAHYPDNKIPTPHLDRLVKQGMSFTDAHSPSAVCSPTRYGLLTGRYSWRTRLQEWVIASYEPPLIKNSVLTLPEFLQQHGYSTSCIGKWHLGFDWPGPQKSQMMEKKNGQRHFTWDFTKRIPGGPVDHGFDYYFGVNLPNQPPFAWIENDRLPVLPTEQYVHDTSEGIVLPKAAVGCPMAPGWKLTEVLPELTRRTVQQVHQLAKQEEPFFLYFSMTSPHEPVVPSADFAGKSGIAPIADFVMETDWAAGQVIKAIDAAEIADNTIVIFTADNGHSHYTGWEDLAKASHAPSGQYRGHKGDVWEGGHRIPFVIRWPGHVTPNSSSRQMICLTDLFATCAELLQADIPQNAAQDSFSFLAAAQGRADSAGRQTMVNHSNFGEFAYRNGPWKLVYKLSASNVEKSRGQPTVAELYNLEIDAGETNNLALQHQDKLQTLTDELEQTINAGSSRPNAVGVNDASVRYDITQPKRWADPTKSP